MRKLLELIAVLALLNVWAGVALADGPTFSAQPDLRPGPQGSTAGGSASATGGDAGPATVATSEPIGASSSTTSPGSTGPSSSSTSATGPGTTAGAPLNASTSEPDPSAPDGSSPTTSGPSADADATQSDVSLSDSKVRANLIANATGAFAGGASGVGFVEDPTYASTCSTAEASPGVPTDASLSTSCGTSWSSASEDFSANDANGNGAAGTPSGSACLLADASAGPTPTTGLSSTCAAQGGATPSGAAGPGTGSANNSQSGAASTDSQATSGRAAATVLGIDLLPSSATEPASVTLLGAMLALAGLVLLRRAQHKS